jgi:hypothetical protein
VLRKPTPAKMVPRLNSPLEMIPHHEGGTMAGRSLEEKLGTDTGWTPVAGGEGASRHPVALAGSAFALGVLAGWFLNSSGKQLYERARASAWHRDHERTVTYDQNLPDSLGRREPQTGQPRYGGTGALGVPPTSAGVPPSGE